MGFLELFLIGVGLAMDAFAVSVGKGLSMRRFDLGQALALSVTFGAFQALMPLLGWLLGAQFERFVSVGAPWIAFALLAFIGAKMIIDAFRDGDGQTEVAQARVGLGELLMLGLATSIDALAVGVSFAFLQVDIVLAIIVIGLVTFAVSFLGVSLGRLFGGKWERGSAVAGGIVLIVIGLKVLADHYALLPF